MKKKFCLVISALIIVLSLAGCQSSSQNKTEYNEDTMKQVAEVMISSMLQMDAATIESFRGASEFALNTTLYESGLPIAADDFIGILSAWETGLNECGAYIGHGDWEVQVSSSEVKLKTQAQFEDMDAAIEFVFNENEELENLTVGAKYSTGQILQKAGMNTLIGMGTVFAVLIFISFLIYLMKYIPTLQARFLEGSTDSQNSDPEVKPVPAVSRTAPSPAQKDDMELAAVISAAIAQAEGKSPDGFIVRSIKRRTTNKWNGGR